jgi:hypothetical protein
MPCKSGIGGQDAPAKNRTKLDAFEKTRRMAKEKFRPARPVGFPGAKTYVRDVEVLENHRNAAGRTFSMPSKLHPSL